MTSGLFALVLTAAVFHASWNFIARRASGNLAIFWWSSWVSTLFLAPAVGYVIYQQGWPAVVNMAREGYVFIIATGIIHSVYFYLLGRAYEHGEISVVYPVARGSGIGLTGFLGWLILDESISSGGLTGIVLICFGILFMGLNGNRRAMWTTGGFTFALGVGATIVAYSIVDKMGVQIVHPIVYIGAMFLLTGLFEWPVVLSRYRGKLMGTMRAFWRSIVMIGIGAAGTYLMILFAMTMGPVSYIVALREFAVVVGATLGMMFLKEPAPMRKILAIMAIVAGLLCIKIGG